MLFISFLLCSCVLLLMPHDVTTKLQLVFSGLFRFPLGTGRVISLAAQSPTPPSDVSREDYAKRRRENLELQNHVDTLMALLDQERSEKEKLSQVRVAHAWGPHGLVPAQVIQALAGSDQIIINRGTRNRLSQGLFILDDNAIVGSIRELDNYQAKGALITDKSSCIPVYIKSAQTNVKGFLSGLGNGIAKIQQIPYQHKVAIGDLVHVQTQPGLLEVPFVVGSVSQCRRDEIEGLLWDITVEPAAELKSLNHVHVIVVKAQ
jgi:cell shape-determining protein MreC